MKLLGFFANWKTTRNTFRDCHLLAAVAGGYSRLPNNWWTQFLSEWYEKYPVSSNAAKPNLVPNFWIQTGQVVPRDPKTVQIR